MILNLQKICADRKDKRSSRGNIAEFGSAFFVFILLGLYPLFNLLFITGDVASIAFITTRAAAAASTQAGHQQALDAMLTEVNSLTNSGIGKMAKLSQSGGYQNCGANLFIVETNMATGACNYYGPNTPYALPANSGNYIYEYKVVSSFKVAPFMNLSAVPYIGKIPMVGQPATLTWSAERAVEHISAASLVAPGGGNTPATGSGASGSGSGSTPGSSGAAGAQPSGCVI